MPKPLESHGKLVKRVLQYLKVIVNFGIKYTNDFDVDFVNYFDLFWARNIDDKRSTSGYALCLRSRIITRRNKKQPTVSLFSNKVECKA